MAANFSAYNRDVSKLRIHRALIASITIALLVVCMAASAANARVDFAFPVLAFCFLALLTPFVLHRAEGDPPVAALSFLAVHTSRPPPAA